MLEEGHRIISVKCEVKKVYLLVRECAEQISCNLPILHTLRPQAGPTTIEEKVMSLLKFTENIT